MISTVMAGFFIQFYDKFKQLNWVSFNLFTQNFNQTKPDGRERMQYQDVTLSASKYIWSHQDNSKYRKLTAMSQVANWFRTTLRLAKQIKCGAKHQKPIAYNQIEWTHTHSRQKAFEIFSTALQVFVKILFLLLQLVHFSMRTTRQIHRTGRCRFVSTRPLATVVARTARAAAAKKRRCSFCM